MTLSNKVNLKTAERLTVAANIRAFEKWVESLAVEAKIPWSLGVGATVAHVKDTEPATILVVMWINPWCWVGLGFLHFYAWWMLREAVGTEQNGYRVKTWVV